MINYKKIFFLFLIPSYLALSLGFFHSYKKYSHQIMEDYRSNYRELAKRYTQELIQLDKDYERLMKTALVGIRYEIGSEIPDKKFLVSIAKKYEVSHLFIIDRNGKFIRSTNEDPSKIPNLYSFSERYKKLQNENKTDYLSTPIILPFPEKELHKFLTMWNGRFYIEVGFKIREMENSLRKLLDKDLNILRADLQIEGKPYSFKYSRPRISEEATLIGQSEAFTNARLVQTEKTGEHKYSLSFEISNREVDSALSEIRLGYILTYFATLLLITLLFFLSMQILRKRVRYITDQIFDLVEKGDLTKEITPLSNNKEIKKFIESINALLHNYRDSSKQLAFQVAHDIRSPLEALKSAREEITKLPELERRSINLAIGRIEEIAYNLLVMKRGGSRRLLSETTHVKSMLIQIIQEKELQYRDCSDLLINFHSDKEAFSAFSNIKGEKFKRIISNLLDNAIEATSFSGKVDVRLTANKQTLKIEIIDSGPLIPCENLDRIFEKGFTTKSEGNGYGLYHAKKEIEAAKGTIYFKQDERTVVEIDLPRGDKPNTFVGAIDLSKIKRIVILDDDESIHLVWKKRFKAFGIELEHFYKAFNLLSVYKEIPEDCFLLSDYELLGEEVNGIDCINRLHAAKNSILVTARADEPQIIEACDRHGIKILPKTMANEVEIFASMVTEKAVLIDDDRLTQLSWTMAAKKAEVDLMTFASVDEFLESAKSFCQTTAIYIDSNLGENLRGEILSEEIYNLGFTDLHIATGFSSDQIQRPDWIKSVIGKAPPFAV